MHFTLWVPMLSSLSQTLSMSAGCKIRPRPKLGTTVLLSRISIIRTSAGGNMTTLRIISRLTMSGYALTRIPILRKQFFSIIRGSHLPISFLKCRIYFKALASFDLPDRNCSVIKDGSLYCNLPGYLPFSAEVSPGQNFDTIS